MQFGVGVPPRGEAVEAGSIFVGQPLFAAGRRSYRGRVVCWAGVGAPPRGEALGLRSGLWDSRHCSRRGAAPTRAVALAGLVWEPRLGAKLLRPARYLWCSHCSRRGAAPTRAVAFAGLAWEPRLGAKLFPEPHSSKLELDTPAEGNPMTEKRYASHRLRDGRWSSSGQIYLVTTVTNGRLPVFADFSAARTLIQVIRQDQLLGSHQTLCFVVMPDHLHWLLQLQNETLPRLVGRIKSISAKRLGQPIWQKGFHDHALRREEDVRSVARYVVSNPLRAGLVERVGDYPHWDAVWI